MKNKMTDLINIVENNGQLVVSSREVARNFGKRHDHVIRHIEEVIRGIPHLGNTPMFFKNTYIHEQNNQKYAEYIMNRDGFSLLVMGFTGKSALEWKLKYIEAFNAMEQKLKTLSLPDFTNPVVAARAWADAQEAKQLAEAHIEQLAPKAQMADDFMLAEGSVNFTALCNMLEIKNRKKFREFLVKNKWCYKNNRQNTKKPWIACVSKVRSGLLVTKAFVNNAFTSTCLYWTLEGINLIKEQMILDEYED